jgi:ribonuclease VapC
VNKCVLDASAVLAYLNREPGFEAVGEWLTSADCLLLATNHAEVLTRLVDHGVPLNDAATAVTTLDVDVISLDAELAHSCAALRVLTRPFGLSLVDRSCLALTQRERCPVLTADRAWLQVAGSLQLDIRCIRPDEH